MPNRFTIILLLAAAPGLAQPPAPGEELYNKNCALCHGHEARGGQGPSLLGPAYRHGIEDPKVTATINDGFADGGMPAFGSALSASEIAALVGYLRQKRAEAPPSTRQPVALSYQPLGIPKGVVKTELYNFRVETVAQTGEPYAFAFLPDGRILITETAGNLRVVDKGRLQLAPVPDAPSGNGLGLRGAGGRSLLDIALDPDYKSNGWIYVVTCRGVKNAKGKLDGLARIERDASATAAGSTTKSSSNSPSTSPWRFAWRSTLNASSTSARRFRTPTTSRPPTFPKPRHSSSPAPGAKFSA